MCVSLFSHLSSHFSLFISVSLCLSPCDVVGKIVCECMWCGRGVVSVGGVGVGVFSCCSCVCGVRCCVAGTFLNRHTVAFWKDTREGWKEEVTPRTAQNGPRRVITCSRGSPKVAIPTSLHQSFP